MKLNWKPPTIKATKATFTWAAEHAEEVHNGAVYLGGTRGVDRPWTEVTLKEVDLPELLKGHYSGDIGQAFVDTMEDLGDRFQDTIVNHVWDIPPGGQKLHKDAPTWETIDDSGELRESQTLEIE
jgi:hypothetical protein